MNRRFADPDLDVSHFVARFEAENRDVFAKRAGIVEAAGVKPGQAVADIGAGTGLFTRMFAEKVGPEGKVYAVEIAPAFLKHIAAEAEKAGLGDRIEGVRSTQESSNLPEGSVDVVFLCATYHHFDNPAAMLDSIRKALKPGGRLVLVEWDLKPDSPEFIRERARGPRSLYYEELGAAGFRRVEERDDLGLTENFLAVFERR
jgi:ubiquinone/menaquinone biosynthesis C-methylase UbiE